MGLLKKLFKGIFKLLFSSTPPREEQMYEVRIKGTINCNGPKPINRVVIMDTKQMQMFSGCKQNEAIEGWIKANYPAAKPQKNYRNFGVEVKPVKKK